MPTLRAAAETLFSDITASKITSKLRSMVRRFIADVYTLPDVFIGMANGQHSAV